MSCIVPTVRGLLTICTSDKNIPFEGLVSALENDRIVFILFTVNDDFVIIWITEVGTFGSLYIVFQFNDTAAEKVTAPAASHEMFPDAILPDPSLFSFHLLPFMMEPSAPNAMLFL